MRKLGLQRFARYFFAPFLHHTNECRWVLEILAQLLDAISVSLPAHKLIRSESTRAVSCTMLAEPDVHQNVFIHFSRPYIPQWRAALQTKAPRLPCSPTTSCSPQRWSLLAPSADHWHKRRQGRRRGAVQFHTTRPRKKNNRINTAPHTSRAAAPQTLPHSHRLLAARHRGGKDVQKSAKHDPPRACTCQGQRTYSYVH